MNLVYSYPRVSLPQTNNLSINKNTTMKNLLYIILNLFAITSFAQQNTSVEIPFLEEKVSIDGKLNESVWNQITPLSSFYNYFPIDEGMAEKQTEVKIFHNGTFLYISAVYHDTENRNNISSLKRDVYYDAFFLSDCFGIVLDTYGKSDNGYTFMVNASGVQYDALIGNINELNESWNTVWESETSREGNDKFYEIAIPLDAINFNAQKNTWGIQFFTNDTKITQYSSFAHIPRNYDPYDLRFTTEMVIENLPKKVSNKFSVVPSIAANYAKDNISNTDSKNIIPSLDAQYNITSALRLDATLNPDFSQVEVDQQVTNLSRFAFFFPERRKFFLENSDLFNNLGTRFSNPFYSRRIGSETDILFGAKLSGNVGTKTRIGLLNAQTKDEDEIEGKNYTVLVGRQNISNALNSTVFLVNTQQNDAFNRVAGASLNFKSKDNRWTSNFNYAQAFTNGIKGDNGFYNADIAYQTRRFESSLSLQRVEKNHITETGFTPRLYNYDALTNTSLRETFNTVVTEVQLRHFPKNSKHIDWMRRFWVENTAVLNNDNTLKDNTLFISPFAIRFKNRAYTYISILSITENLRYNFDFLQNGNFITPDNYQYTYGRIGYWSPNNRKFYYALRFEYGQFYKGTRLNPEVRLSYRLLPRAVLSASYQFNDVKLKELGQKTFHLARLTSEIYFSNRLNWTTYLQYNTQANNFNINSRFQWEYKPLSYVYLVFSNNYDNQFLEKNWGISFKINRRLDF